MHARTVHADQCTHGTSYARTVHAGQCTYGTSYARTVHADQYTYSTSYARTVHANGRGHATVDGAHAMPQAAAVQLLPRDSCHAGATHSRMHTRRLQEASPRRLPNELSKDFNTECKRRARALTAQPHRAERQRERRAVRTRSDGWGFICCVDTRPPDAFLEPCRR